jgi:hypothetical protein
VSSKIQFLYGKRKGRKLKGASPKGLKLAMEPVVNIESRSAEHPNPPKMIERKKKKRKSGK